MKLGSTLRYAVYTSSKLFSGCMTTILDNEAANHRTSREEKGKKTCSMLNKHHSWASSSRKSTKDQQSNILDPQIQHEEHDDHLSMTRAPSSPCTMSPSSIKDDHSQPTSPSPDVMSSSRATSAAWTQTKTKKAAKSVAKYQEGAVIGKRPKASDYEEVVGALLLRTTKV